MGSKVTETQKESVMSQQDVNPYPQDCPELRKAWEDLNEGQARMARRYKSETARSRKMKTVKMQRVPSSRELATCGRLS